MPHAATPGAAIRQNRMHRHHSQVLGAAQPHALPQHQEPAHCAPHCCWISHLDSHVLLSLSTSCEVSRPGPVRPPAFRPQQKKINQSSTALKIHLLLDKGYPHLMSLNTASTLLFTLISQAANITPTRLPKQDVCSGSRGNKHTTLLLKFRHHFIISS